MKKISVFLQGVVAFIGIGVLIFLLWEPHLEGRNVGATLYEIYFHDPFLTYVYITSVAFFIGLYEVFRLLGHMTKDIFFSEYSLPRLRTIKYCAVALAISILGAEIYFMTIQRDRGEDIAGGVVIGFFLLIFSIVTMVVMGRLERLSRTRLP